MKVCEKLSDQNVFFAIFYSKKYFLKYKGLKLANHMLVIYS